MLVSACRLASICKTKMTQAAGSDKDIDKAFVADCHDKRDTWNELYSCLGKDPPELPSCFASVQLFLAPLTLATLALISIPRHISAP